MNRYEKKFSKGYFLDMTDEVDRICYEYLNNYGISLINKDRDKIPIKEFHKNRNGRTY